MADIVLYTTPGVTRVFLGTVQVGEESPSDPVQITGKNNMVGINARQVTVAVDDPGVQLSANNEGPWTDTAGPFELVAPDGEFNFWGRVLPPSEGEASVDKFNFTVDYTTILE